MKTGKIEKVLLIIALIALSIGIGILLYEEINIQPKKVQVLDKAIEDLEKSPHTSRHQLIDIAFDLNQASRAVLETKIIQVEAKGTIGDAKLALAIYYNRQRKVPTYEQLKSHIVYITGIVPDKKYDNYMIERGSSWIGTGFVFKVSDKYTWIITNKHVAGIYNNKEGETTEIYIGDTKEERVKAQIVRFHPKYDVALLLVHGKLKGKQQIKGLAVAKPQDKVYIVGHHLARYYLYGEGVFAGYQKNELPLAYEIIQVPVLFGNSGSAVFNQNGYVVALIFAVNRATVLCVDGAHGVAVPGEILLDFLINWSF